MYDLNDLPVDTINVLPADSLEALTEGHGMTEIAASSSGPVPSCDNAEFDEES
ncbi:thiomuracin/GE37468 family thiazolyl RiPP peptide [Nonomuraea insulae]|uniref:Thiomuracin/GE37468 family thiazolyl RiPP peptide n=1 Tax=Nonomuraea insulae TaxID=1616787 RepID=A0ABW1CKT5_9ACTN